MDNLLDFLLKPEGAMLLMFLVVPGFVMLRTLESMIAGERANAGEALVDIIVFSAVNDGLWAIAFLLFGIHDLSKLPGWGLFLLTLLVIVASPILLALIYKWIRDKMARPGGAVHLIAKPWDYFFSECLKEPKQIVVTFADGRRIGGFWQDPCFASSYPADEQLFFTEVYNVDQRTGLLIDKIPNHSGILVDKRDVVLIEFFDEDRPLLERPAQDC